MRSFIVSGASASGKSTLVRAARLEGYLSLATHTTRMLRTDEVAGEDMLHVSEEVFEANFADSVYMEPSLDFARLHATGIYYGTPRAWIGSLATNEGYCAMPTSLTIARNIHREMSVAWVHLVCPDDVRRQRLEQRHIPVAQIEARMSAGESIHVPEQAGYVINTAEFSVGAIMQFLKEQL